jgi:peroxiredoxin
MKFYHIFLLAIVFSGCTKVGYIEFNGTMTGISNGVFVIKNLDKSSLYSEFITGEKLYLKKTLQNPGYYSMQIARDVYHDNRRVGYDVYLEPGTYTIKVNGNELYKYPTITTSSKIQNELSAYYTVLNDKAHDAENETDSLFNLVYGNNAAPVSSAKYDAQLKKLTDAATKRDNIVSAVFADFINKHPQSQVAAHLLAQIDYKKDPSTYYNIYQKFTDDQKNTPEGKAEGDDLKMLAKLAPGAVAPALTGKTLDGKDFNTKSVNKKVILVEFWRSDSEVSRNNHKSLLTNSDLMTNKDFTVVSVSVDTAHTTWANAVNEDKLPWPQINDLKGQASPNMQNWGVGILPTYDLVDGNWHIIKRDVSFDDIDLAIKDQLKTH